MFIRFLFEFIMLYHGYHHFPCVRPAHVGKSWSLAQLQVLPSIVSLMFMLSLGEELKS